MSLRFLRLLTLALLLSALTACGDDDVTPPPDTDGGTADAGTRDAGRADGGGTGVDGAACTDEDGDGHGALPCGDDCDDTDATRFPGNTETCDGDDEDCNDSTFGPDGDSDGFPSVTCCNGADNCGTDCNDALNTVNPGAAEQCNGGVDDDCDGLADAADGVCVPCPSGYRGVDLDCENIRECDEFAPCGAAVGTTCTDTPGSYTCGCPAGYVTPAMGGTCMDVDECAVDVCGAGRATCTNLGGSYACTCLAGYTVASTGAPCVDVDECAMGTPCNVGIGSCANIGGSYVCTCNAGYEAPMTGGTCAEVNECAAGTDDCADPPGGICGNIAGSYTCACAPRYIGTARGTSGCILRFTDLGDGTIRDNNGSGLEWQRDFSPSTQSQAASVTYCTTLPLDGGGWRLPTIDELLSIVDTTRGSPPAIDLLYFPGTPGAVASPVGIFWSSSPSPPYGMIVNFSAGFSSYLEVSRPYRARCVR